MPRISRISYQNVVQLRYRKGRLGSLFLSAFPSARQGYPTHDQYLAWARRQSCPETSRVEYSHDVEQMMYNSGLQKLCLREHERTSSAFLQQFARSPHHLRRNPISKALDLHLPNRTMSYQIISPPFKEPSASKITRTSSNESNIDRASIN